MTIWHKRILTKISNLIRRHSILKRVCLSNQYPVPFIQNESISEISKIRIMVVGVGGAGGNAVLRMARCTSSNLNYLAVNTDAQALKQMNGVSVCAIGPNSTRGFGSGGNPNTGRKAIRESQLQVAELLTGADVVFVTAGMGGGTGTGAAATVAGLARKQGALTVGVVTTPFSFEGPRRQEVAQQGLHQLSAKVDTLITVENDKLLPLLGSKVSLETAFVLADEALRQGVQGISEIVETPGMINVDFADVKSVISNGGPSFMAVGEGKGKSAAMDAIDTALTNPLFDTAVHGARGILLNVKGGKDLGLDQIHEIAGAIKKASSGEANVVFGVVQDPCWKKRVSVTLIATGLASESRYVSPGGNETTPVSVAKPHVNGYRPHTSIPSHHLT